MSKKSKTPFLLRSIQWMFPKVEMLSRSLAAAWFRHLFFRPLRYPVPEKESEAAAAAEKYVLAVDSMSIQCYAWGSGPAVLMIHGWAGRGTQFRKFIKPLNEAGFRVVAMDGPAHGNSSGKRTDIIEFSKAIQAVHEREKPVAMIGHSFGGPASLFAISEGTPNPVQIMIASPAIGEEIIGAFLKALNASPAIGQLFRKFILTKTGKPFEYFSALEIIKRVPPDIHLLLIHDRDDAEVPIHHPRMLQQAFPACELFETSQLGHNRILKDDEVISHCVTFIKNKASWK
jgi:predicted alpha/beta hydrolase family esterase